MAVSEFKKQVRNLVSAVEVAMKNDIDLADASVAELHDFKAKQREAMRVSVFSAIKKVEIASNSLFTTLGNDVENQKQVESLISSVRTLRDAKSLSEVQISTANLLDLAAELPDVQETKLESPEVPAEIKEEIDADVAEIDRCMKVGAYRSSVILCGRIMETALHRKYYEVTQNDLLEKSPGIGLGNLIKKMAEKGIAIDPALGNQIHLINQVRVHSVHKKQQAFNPSQQQAQAIYLYTMDVVGKLWLS
jgi:hypothetical protein